MNNSSKFVVIGLGAFGREVARTLKEYEAEVLVIDKDLHTINSLKQEGFDHAVRMDSTDPATLAGFVRPEDIVVLAMGESFEANILTIGNLNELGVTQIYARATADIQAKIFQRMQGVETIFPERMEGKRFGLRLLFHDSLYLEEYAPGIFIGEFPVPEWALGKSIIDLHVRKRYKLNVIALKETIPAQENKPERTVIHPVDFENTALTGSHILILVGNDLDIAKFVKAMAD